MSDDLPEGRYVGTAALAAALGDIKTQRVVQMIEAGLIDAIQPSPRGRYRIPRAEAERVIAEAKRRVSG
jgi:hypothetical protein